MTTGAPLPPAHSGFAGRPPVHPLRVLADAAVLTLLVVLAGGALAPAYGTPAFLRALAVGAGTGALAAVVPRLLRWPGAVTVVLVPLGLVLLGPAGALPEAAAGGVLPTAEALRLLAVGVVDSWKQLLTVAVPVGSGGALLVPVLLAAAVLTALAVVLATRTRLPLLALLPAAAMAAVAAALGSATPFLPQYLAPAWAVVAVVWAAWRRGTSGRPGLQVGRPLALLLVLLPALAAGSLLGPQLVPAEATRATLRDVVQPPFDPSTVASPLSAYRRYVVTDRDAEQLSVSGLPQGVPLRLAVLSDYNGRYALTSPDVGTFSRVGERVSGAPAGTPVTLTVRVSGYSDIWLPSVGFLRGIDFTGDDATRLREEFRYNRATGAGVVTGGLRPGDSWTLTASVPRQPTVAELGDTPVGAGDATTESDAAAIPEVVARAGEWGGSGSPAQVVENLRAKLHEVGYVSHGEQDQGVPGGHGADRIRQLLTAEVMRGDAEQYAVALALMVRAKGFPARVVVGFRNPGGPGDEALTGAALTAWVEVPFQGFGWVAFDPLPDEQKPPPTQKPDQDQQQAQPQRAQPPPPPVPPRRAQADPQDQDDDPQDPQQDDSQDTPPPPPPGSGSVWGWVALGVGVPLLLLLPIAVVLLLKLRRRRRLAGTGTPDQRIAGAWRYLVGRLADLGAAPSAAATTRAETARQLGEGLAARVGGPSDGGPASRLGPGAGPGDPGGDPGSGVLLLARDADGSVFAPEPVDPAAARAYWERVDTELAGIESRFSRWRRWRARLSVRSLREEHR